MGSGYSTDFLKVEVLQAMNMNTFPKILSLCLLKYWSSLPSLNSMSAHDPGEERPQGSGGSNVPGGQVVILIAPRRAFSSLLSLLTP